MDNKGKKSVIRHKQENISLRQINNIILMLHTHIVIFIRGIVDICHLGRVHLSLYLFGFYSAFNSTGHITEGSSVGRGNQYIQLVKVLYYKLNTNYKH